MMMLAAMPLTGLAGELKAVTDAEKGTVAVTLEGKPFMGLIFRGHAKPVVYPVIGPGGVAMTRHWPLEAAAADTKVVYSSLIFRGGGGTPLLRVEIIPEDEDGASPWGCNVGPVS